MKWCHAIVVATLLLASAAANAQQTFTTNTPPFSGTVLGDGITPASALFVAGSAPLSLGYPSTISIWVKGTSIFNGINIASAGSFGTNGIILTAVTPGSDAQDTLTLQDLVSPSGASNNKCQNGGSLFNARRLCADIGYVNDGNWHHLCAVHTAAGAISMLYIDAIVRAQGNTGSGVPVPGTFWAFVGGSATVTRGIDLWHRALSPADCALVYNRGIAGFSANFGSLATGLAGEWLLGGGSPCTGSGATFSCPDTSGNNNPITLGKNPPTCAITSPPAGATTGTVSLQGTSTDAIGVSHAAWSLTDGSNTLSLSGAITSSPYTQSFDTTRLIDGTYTLTMTCTNLGGVSATATETLTLGNSVTAKNYYFSPAGSDSNNCTSPAAACATATKFNALTYHGGDTINFDNAHGALTTTKNFMLCGSGASGIDLSNGNDNAPALISCTANVISGVKQLVVQPYGGGTCTALAASTNCAPIVQANSPAQVNPFEAICVQNVTISGLFITGGTGYTTPPFANQSTGGITIGNASSGTCTLAASNIVVQNNYITNFGQWGVAVWNYGGNQSTAGFTVTQNTITNPTTTTAASFGILLNSGGLQGTVSSNIVSNIAGVVNAQSSGVGIEVANNFTTSSSILISDNSVFNNMYNSQTCGGGDAIETFHVSATVTVQNNEIYNNGLPGTTFGCDNGAIDFDLETTNQIAQYNYTHGNWGYSIQSFSNEGTAENSIARFNISENDARGNSVAVLAMAALVPGPFVNFKFYNNTVYWDQTGWPATHQIIPIGLGVACPATGSISANNLFMMQGNHTNGRAIFVDMGNSFCNSGSQILTFQNNNYYAFGGGTIPFWNNIGCVNCSVTTLAGWKASGIVGDANAQNVNPNITGTVPVASPCGTPSTGPGPACPAAYKLTHGSPMVGAAYTGLTSAPYNQVITNDYFGNACSNVSNIGADACSSP